MLTLLYLLSFLDRGNIGNAKIEGLSEDLNLTGPQYNWCLTAFFFTYCAFEVPSNMLLVRVPVLDPVVVPVQAADAATETLQTFHLAALHHGSVGRRDDTHGHRSELPRPPGCSYLPWRS